MTSLLVIIVLVFVSVAIWQLTKIFDLTQIGDNAENYQVANDNDNSVNGYLMFAFLVFIYLTTIYCVVKFGHFPLMSNPASEHGVEVDRLMWISMILIFFVQTVTQALLHYFAFKYRGKKGKTALYFADNNKLEAIWSIIPAITLAGLILYGLYAWTNIMFVDEETENPMVVEIYAKQFGWEVRYAGQDNVLGKANVRYIEGINTLGVDLADPNAQDDIPASELHLPKGTKVVFKIRSQDVLHSAYMPHFRAQMNCVPGMVTQFAFTPTVTTVDMRNSKAMIEKVDAINKIRTEKSKELVAKGLEALDPYTFDYLLLCNKICGKSHYNMQMKIVVESPEDFKKWLGGQTTLVQNIKAQEQPVEADKATIDTATVVKDSTVIVQVVK
ncbi:MAG TPA: cytochrome c oxidase subunit II [Flavobacterium sp.]|nr:cytochrome c oxidase subunit II [Flavobacterium sp.]